MKEKIKKRLEELGFDNDNYAGIKYLLKNDDEAMEKFYDYISNDILTEDSRNDIFEYAFKITGTEKQEFEIVDDNEEKDFFHKFLREHKDLYGKYVVVKCNDNTIWRGIFHEVLDEDISIIIGGVLIPFSEINEMKLGKKPIGKVRYIGKSFGIEELTNLKIYDVIAIEDEFLRIIDDSGEDYLYLIDRPCSVDNPDEEYGKWKVVEDYNGELKSIINNNNNIDEFIKTHKKMYNKEVIVILKNEKIFKGIFGDIDEEENSIIVDGVYININEIKEMKLDQKF